MSVAPTRHWVTCGLKPGVGGIFFLLWPISVSCYLSLGFCSNISSVHVHSLGNSKATAHVAADLQCRLTVKPVKNRKRISQRTECQKSLVPPKEPLITSPLPQHPWKFDLFHLDSKTYLIVVDYFSHYPEVVSSKVHWPYKDIFREKEKEYKKAQKQIRPMINQHQVILSPQQEPLDDILWR